MTFRWHLIVESEPRSGAENMATDCSLLRAAQGGAAFLRLYRWSPGCLSFGRNELARVRYDRDAIARLGLDTVRRPTGGRAVWHDSEVTYAVAGPANMFGSLRKTYIRIHAVLAAALRRLGAAAQLAERRCSSAARLGTGACFAAPVGGEIVVGDRKLVGSAQVREGGAFLQHGSVLLANGQDLVAHVTRGGCSTPAATSLDMVLGHPVGFEEVAEAIVREAQCAWDGPWHPGEARCDGDDLEQFNNPAWTWRR